MVCPGVYRDIAHVRRCQKNLDFGQGPQSFPDLRKHEYWNLVNCAFDFGEPSGLLGDRVSAKIEARESTRREHARTHRPRDGSCKVALSVTQSGNPHTHTHTHTTPTKEKIHVARKGANGQMDPEISQGVAHPSFGR